MARYKKIDRNHVYELLEQGHTVNRVAELLSCTRQTISRIKNETDIKLLPVEDRADIWREYYDIARRELSHYGNQERELQELKEQLIRVTKERDTYQAAIYTMRDWWEKQKQE